MIAKKYKKLALMKKYTFYKKKRRSQKLHLSSDPSRIRTCDRSLRRRMLYPAELWDQAYFILAEKEGSVKVIYGSDSPV